MSRPIFRGPDGVIRTPEQHAAWESEREAAAMPDTLTRMAPAPAAPAQPQPFRYDDPEPAPVTREAVEKAIIAALEARFIGSRARVNVSGGMWSSFDALARVDNEDTGTLIASSHAVGGTPDAAVIALARLCGVSL